VALLSQDADGLALMQQTMDMVTAGFGLRISASTTEVLSVAAAAAQKMAAPKAATIREGHGR
jgi:hypothetical protein